MPSTTPLTDAINALTTYSNTVTGASDTTLSDAVATLAAGYGGGGGWTTDGIAQNTEPNGVVTLSDSVTTLRPYAFAYKPITGITANGVTTVYGNVFFHSGLTSVHLPLATADSNYTGSVFESCASLITAVLPSWNKPMYSSFFLSCTALEAVDIYGHSFGGSYVFRYCTALKTLILRSPSVVTLGNANHFNNSSFASGGTGGDIYVPQALLATYPTSGNWATINGYGTVTWKAIEGSYYETHYADGTPIE